MNEEQIRVGFEAWFLTYSVPADPTELAKDKDGYYLYDPAFFAWEGWKAAIASQPTDDRVRELEKDAAIGKLVRSKLISCNDVPVSRCHISADEVQAIDQAKKEEQE